MARPTIKSMRHKVVFCSSRDEISSGSLTLARQEVLRTTASIEPRLTSMFSKEGRAVVEDKNRTTHIVTIWNRPGLNITSAAWIYETFRKSSPRWFKILGTAELTEDLKYLRIEVNLAERGDDLIEPREDKEPNCFEPRKQVVPGL